MLLYRESERRGGEREKQEKCRQVHKLYTLVDAHNGVGLL